MMDKSVREGCSYRNRSERESPSFSSTLLDAIYRSIDEGHGHEREEQLVLYRETTRKKKSEKWTEKKVSEKVVVSRKSVAELERKSRNDDPVLLNSSSSSSDSSCDGVFSSSETESRSSSYTIKHNRPKPIRTSVSVQPGKFNKHLEELNTFGNSQQQERTCASVQPKHESGRFRKTKSRALKIYGDLKKVKQPISPGGKLASFLNSLFTAGNAKKAKVSSEASSEKKSKSAHESTCSSASSFSRSCLSKTPSSTEKFSNGAKRSVRFIVDEDCQPCGHKSLHKEIESNLQTAKAVRNCINEELKFHLTEKNRRVEEAARDLLKNYQKKVQLEFDLRNVCKNGEEFDEDEDDAASCSSSDLFELDNLSAIGIERYREELPVYETTYLDTNRAIANGLIL